MIDGARAFRHRHIPVEAGRESAGAVSFSKSTEPISRLPGSDRVHLAHPIRSSTSDSRCESSSIDLIVPRARSLWRLAPHRGAPCAHASAGRTDPRLAARLAYEVRDDLRGGLDVVHHGA
jgi:hypothetical protein